jgi:hypothetical protein
MYFLLFFLISLILPFFLSFVAYFFRSYSSIIFFCLPLELQGDSKQQAYVTLRLTLPILTLNVRT